jgi:teichuronic acid biosynthesis glycosyltransferase TuaH
MDIFVGYCEEWQTGLVTSKQHYIRRLAKDNSRVIYAEVPKSIFHILISKKILSNIYNFLFEERFYESEENIWVMKSYTLFPYSRKFSLFDSLLLNKFNQLSVLRQIKKCFKKIEFNDPVLLSYYPFIHPVIKKINFKKIIFHVVDNWMAFNVPRSMNSLIKKMTITADVTITSSSLMHKELSKFSEDVYLLDHGTDLDLFKPVINFEIEEHKLICDMKKPIIGYYGALHKIDFNLVFEVSKIHNDKSFIFIGPISGEQGIKNNLIPPKNVFLFESLSREELPNILVGLDLFWMPFKNNEITKYMLPIKIFEVLSAGLPVISTDLLECRRVGKDLVKFANDVEGFSDLIDYFMCENNIDLRYHRAFSMHQYDWNERYKIFKNYITRD